VETSGVTIYTVSTRDQVGPKTTQDKILQSLADRSGGEAIFPVDTPSVSKAFRKLHDLIRSRYLVAYKPADFVPNGKYRTITITVKKNGKPLQVRARKGYYTRLEPTY
jgi:Ca-activated chloride channel family protein